MRQFGTGNTNGSIMEIDRRFNFNLKERFIIEIKTSTMYPVIQATTGASLVNAVIKWYHQFNAVSIVALEGKWKRCNLVSFGYYHSSQGLK